MSLLVIASERFAGHLTPPGHPERVERAETMDVVAARWKRAGGAVAVPRAATSEDLLRVHSAEHLQTVGAAKGRAAMLDPDTFTSPDSYDISLLAAGAALVGIDHAIDKKGTAFAMVRPPGHHAERSRAMGFCLFNNVAVAAAYALHRGMKRVAVVDYDVHHGNGTQWIFYEDPRVLYVSTHQYPFYPGTGAAPDVGRGDGRGFTLNVPLEAGAGDDDFGLVFTSLVIPVLDSFKPDLLIVSAGYDAHTRDPLGGMRLSSAAFGSMDRRLREIADTHCGGRLLAVTEGGYDLQALSECLQGTIDVLAATPGANRQSKPSAVTDAGATKRAQTAIAAVRAAQKPFWPAL